MRVGIFESIFPGGSLEEKFRAMMDHGFSSTQLDLSSVGLETLPDTFPPETADTIIAAGNACGILISALQGTFNMIDPDPAARAQGLDRLLGAIAFAPSIAAPVVTICTGTRDTTSMWRHHPDNTGDASWKDLVTTLEPAVRAAESVGIILGIEPEPANVINNAVRARKILDEFGSKCLGIIADPANLLAGDRERDPEAVLSDAFDLLGDRIVLAHGKDLDAEGEFCAVGTGIVPWSRFRELLREASYEGSMICHGLAMPDLELAMQTLREADFPI